MSRPTKHNRNSQEKLSQKEKYLKIMCISTGGSKGEKYSLP
jgi:hypothetical protein